jgi:hypothetical protein
MSDFFSHFRTPTNFDRSAVFATANLRTSRREEEEEKERTFLDRLFAPFEAPQQTLFAATKGIHERGLSVDVIWDALSHGARYFNPWSNQQRIDPDEIRRIFLGDEEMGAGAQFGTNLAISLLYDPLLFAGLAKGLGVLNTATRTGRNIARVANPAGAMIEAGLYGTREYLAPLVGGAVKRVLGEERATQWGTAIMQNLVNRYYGVPQELREKLQVFDQQVARWRDEAYTAMKSAERLGGRPAQRLLTEALELDAAYLATAGGSKLPDYASLNKKMQSKLAALERKLEAEGINKDLFWEVYGNYRRLDDKIGELLVRNGLISRDEFKALEGVHLRRMYMAAEHPLDAAKRIEDLIEAGQIPSTDTHQFSIRIFRDHLNRLRKDLDDSVLKQRAPTTDQIRANARPAQARLDVETYHNKWEYAVRDRAKDGDLTGAYRKAIEKMRQLEPYPEEYLQQAWIAARISSLVGGPGMRRATDIVEDAIRYAESYGHEVGVREFRNLLNDLRRGTDPISVLGLGPEHLKYFQEGDRVGFNVKQFTKDLDLWLRQNSNASADEVFNYIRHEMLGGAKMTPKFWEAIGNYISGSMLTVRGGQWYADKLRSMAFNPRLTWKTINERLEIVSKRENMPELIRQALGEVLEASPRIASQASDAGRLLETRRFLDSLAGVKRVDQETARLIEQVKSAKAGAERQNALKELSRHTGIVDEGELARLLNLREGDVLSKTGTNLAALERSGIRGPAVQLPNDPSYGELAGMWVQPSVARIIQHMEGVGTIYNEARRIHHKLGELIRQGVGHFKVFKVILDPTAQFRNFIGNAVLMDMIGTSPFRVDRLIKAGNELIQYAKTGNPGKYLRLANESGVSMFQHTFSRAELQEFARNISLDPITRKNFEGVFTGFYRALHKMLAAPEAIGGRVFEFNEKLFKLTVFIDKYEEMARGMAKAGRIITPEAQRHIANQAATLADRALFDYSNVPFLIDWARQYGIVPFITFPFKAAPYALETLYERPHRVLKYHRTVEEINRSLAGSSEDVAREINALPDYLRDKLVVRLPFEDAHGRPLYVDLSFFMPWYVIDELKEQAVDPLARALGLGEGHSMGERSLTDFGLRDGVLNPPIMVLLDGIRRNQDSLGRPIYKPGMSEIERFNAYGEFLWQFMAPPSWPGGSRANSIGRAMQALATNEPEKLDWVNKIGGGIRYNMGQDSILPRPGQMPVTQAQVGGSQIAQALGLDPMSPTSAFIGAFEGLFGGAYASDRTQQTMNTLASMGATRTEIFREMAKIRSNPTLSQRDKLERLRRLQEELQERQRQASDILRRM